MSVPRSASLIAVPLDAAVAAAREGRGYAAAGIGLDVRGPLADGDGVWIRGAGTGRVQVRRDAVRLSAPGLRYELAFRPAAEGTVLLARGVDLARMRAHADWIGREAARWTPLIVGGAAVCGGRLLVAQRSYPKSLAGRYELPGGKVEPGESPRAALMREWHEELGVAIRTGRRIGPEVVVGRRMLRTYAVRITAGEPEPQEHARLRWVGPGELAGLDWLPADRALLSDLRALLQP